MRALKAELQIRSNTEFLLDAMPLSIGGVGTETRPPDHQRKRERRRRMLVFPRLERVAPEPVLPRVEIQWTERELRSLGELASAAEASRPTQALIRAMRD